MEKCDVDQIIRTLGSMSESERIFAINNLAQVEGKEKLIIPRLIAALDDNSETVRNLTIEILIKKELPSVSRAVSFLLDSKKVSLRSSAITILEKKEPLDLGMLYNYFSSPWADVRKFAVDTLAKITKTLNSHKPYIFSILIDSLKDENENVAAAAAEALGLTKNDLAVPFLLKHASRSDCSSWLQCHVIVALTRISTLKSRGALKKLNQISLSSEAKVYLGLALTAENS